MVARIRVMAVELESQEIWETKWAGFGSDRHVKIGDGAVKGDSQASGLGNGCLGCCSLSKERSKLLVQCQAHIKYWTKVSHEYYHKFSFRWRDNQ
jgi:hypothetical protein